MDLESKLSSKISQIQSFADVKGVLHHMELNGHNPAAKKRAAELTLELGASYPHSSRLTFGQSTYHDALEEELAQYMQKEAACLMNLGYLGVFSTIDAITDRHDILIYDQKVHACIIDGVRIHNGRSFSFKHNDVEHLETQLKRAQKFYQKGRGTILVLVDGVYSMYGEQAPLKQIAELKTKYDFNIVVDDSHGFGIIGENGRGTPESQGVENSVDLYISTFTKAMGSIGGFVCGKKAIMDYLRYNTRGAIFSRTMPLPQVLTVTENLKTLKAEPFRRAHAWNNTKKFQNGMRNLGFDIGKPESPITPVRIVGEDSVVVPIGLELKRQGIFTYTVCYPVVAKGTFLIRMVPTYNHTDEDIEKTLSVFQKLKENYKENWLSL